MVVAVGMCETERGRGEEREIGAIVRVYEYVCRFFFVVVVVVLLFVEVESKDDRKDARKKRNRRRGKRVEEREERVLLLGSIGIRVLYVQLLCEDGLGLLLLLVVRVERKSSRSEVELE